jgi:hypothetical protein
MRSLFPRNARRQPTPDARLTAVPTASPTDTFLRTGMIEVRGAFGRDDAMRMQDVVWRELFRRYGIERDEPATWDRHEPVHLTATKKHRAFSAICGLALGERLDELLGPGRWTPPDQYGNVLVSMPNASEWRVPHTLWHSDFPATIPFAPTPVVKVWALFDDVAPGGAGTPQLLGSHALFARYVEHTDERDYKRLKHGFLKSHPWLQALTRDHGDPGRNRVFTEGVEIDGVELRVVECAGAAGDIFITHPWVFHSLAVNATARPRLMRSFAVWRHDNG